MKKRERAVARSLRTFAVTKGIPALLILLMGCVAGCRWSSLTGGDGVPHKGNVAPSAFYSEAELEELYFEHRESFQEIVEIVLASDSLRQHIRDKNEDDWAVYAEIDQRFFTAEDWEKIVAFLKDIKPHMIMRSLKHGDDIVYFTFNSGRRDGKLVLISLYNIKNPETKDFYDKSNVSLQGFKASFQEIDTNWWIEVEEWSEMSGG